jgi:PPK2 family polyphosphate:nucleotide phosphotransferase
MSLFESLEPRSVATDSQWLAPFDGSLRADEMKYSGPRAGVGIGNRLKKERKQLQPLQEALYAGKQYSVLCIFQALDAAGKDGTIREVFEELDPAGVRVAAFKRPTALELAHDFLWRTTLELPRRGEIGIFNRSYYEDVLTVRVHPEYLKGQYPDAVPDTSKLWPARYQAIREHEKHLAISNTVILKFWLNVSPREQSRRFLDRIDEADKRWKFSAHDVYEAGFRDAYNEAALDMLNQTSRPWAPWFVLPADNKPYMRQQVAAIVRQSLASLPLEYPQPDVKDSSEMQEIAGRLRQQLKDSRQ